MLNPILLADRLGVAIQRIDRRIEVLPFSNLLIADGPLRCVRYFGQRQPLRLAALLELSQHGKQVQILTVRYNLGRIAGRDEFRQAGSLGLKSGADLGQSLGFFGRSYDFSVNSARFHHVHLSVAIGQVQGESTNSNTLPRRCSHSTLPRSPWRFREQLNCLRLIARLAIVLSGDNQLDLDGNDVASLLDQSITLEPSSFHSHNAYPSKK